MRNINTENLMLAVLSAGGSASFKPVQIQKLFFLIDEKLSSALGGRFFNFEPYDYGPYDSSVYKTIDALARDKKIEILVDSSGWSKRSYKLTEAGLIEGQKILDNQLSFYKSFIFELVKFVISLSFTELVSAIYKAYPEMRKNSVFQD